LQKGGFKSGFFSFYQHFGVYYEQIWTLKGHFCGKTDVMAWSTGNCLYSPEQNKENYFPLFCQPLPSKIFEKAQKKISDSWQKNLRFSIEKSPILLCFYIVFR